MKVVPISDIDGDVCSLEYSFKRSVTKSLNAHTRVRTMVITVKSCKILNQRQERQYLSHENDCRV